MISDPYKVLGVDENCSDAELKKAYRELAKKYHPDANPDDPSAEEKFKQVQEAYRQIVDARQKGTSAYGSPQGGYGGNGYSDYNGGYGSSFDDFFGGWADYSDRRRAEEEAPELQAARNYINSGHYDEAMTALSGVPEADRNARWYYYAAVASQARGSNVDALNYAKRASDMEPDNAEYRALMQSLQSGGTWYTRRGESYGGFNPVSNPAGWCLSMLALNAACNCCINGGRFF